LILNELWQDPVWSKVIAGVIVFIIVSILRAFLAYSKGWLPKLTTTRVLQQCDVPQKNVLRIMKELDKLHLCLSMTSEKTISA
jgi:hypothetical protein